MVVVILAIFVAMAVPRFQTTYLELQLSNQARSLAKFLTYAQERAVIEGKTYRFQTDPTRRRYWLMAEKEDEEGEALHFVRIRGRYGQTTHLSAGISLESQDQTILFYPDGGADLFVLSLKNERGNEFILRSGKLFGYVRIEETESI